MLISDLCLDLNIFCRVLGPETQTGYSIYTSILKRCRSKCESRVQWDHLWQAGDSRFSMQSRTISDSAARVRLHNTIYTGTFIDTPKPSTLRIRHDLSMGVDTSGAIAFITSSTDLTQAKFLHDFDSGVTVHHVLPKDRTTFFFPGFIDTHTHASQYPNTGIFGSSTLLSWLETYTFPMESSFSDLGRAKRVYDRVVDRTLANGTTCAAYYATLHVPATNLLADICLSRGQRALIGRVCMDRMSPDGYRDESAEEAVSCTERVIDHCKEIDPGGEIVGPVVTPRFAPSCTEASLSALGKLHQEKGIWCQTHVSENHAELELVKKLFPKAKDYVSVYDEHDLLSERTILAHAVHLSDDEVQLIKSREAKVSHCPTSNTSLTSGTARVREMMGKGVAVSLGTDMSGGYSPSIREVAKAAMMASRHLAMEHGDSHKLSLEEVLYLGTLGGAIAVGLEGAVGSFEVGKRFDAQLIGLDDVRGDEKPTPETGGDNVSTVGGQADCFGWETWEDRVAEWVWTGDDRNVCVVFVDGRKVHSTAKDPLS